MNSAKTPWWALASVLVAAAVSLASMSFRYRVESRDKAVTLAAEMESIEALGSAEGRSFQESVQKLKEAGLGAIVASEESVGDLIDQGRVRMVPDTASTPNEVLVSAPPETLARVVDALRAASPGLVTLPPEISSRGSWNIARIRNLTAGALRHIVVGLKEPAGGPAKDTGLPLVARFSNPEGTNATVVTRLIQDSKNAGAKYFLPMGDQVLGRRENLDALIQALRVNGMLFADPEFAKLGGTSNVRDTAPELIVRLHSAQSAELDKMTDAAAIERYTKAAGERGMRILLLRPLTLSGGAPLDAFAEFIHQINAGLRREGLSIGAAHPIEDPAPPRWLFPAIGLAAAPALFFVASAFLSGLRAQALIGLLLILIGVGAYSDTVRPYTALVCAMGFPALSFLILDSRRSAPILVSYIHMTITSAVGGLCVAGLLNGLNYLVVADQFIGVKVAHYLPVVLVGAFFLKRLADPKKSLASPVSWSQAVLFFVIFGALTLMFMRTGNDNPEAVSGLEIKMRSLLESFLVVRPRTKEIFFGHPALIIGLGMLALQTRMGERLKRLSGWTALVLTLGAIGQTSVVNTLCHLHTPLEVSLVRIGVGTLVGGILGALIWMALRGRLSKLEGHT